MRRTFYGLAFGFAAFAVTGALVYTQAADLRKPKNFEGIITQVNLGDGSFVMRLRDGSLVTVNNPIAPNLFLSVKGILQDNDIVNAISEFKIKDPNGKDAIPQISSLDPGSAQVGDTIKILGSGFTKKNNSVNIGDVNYAVTGIPSKDGKSLSFKLPVAPCNQRIKLNCPTTVLPWGNYKLSVLNENGLSNILSFQVLPLPPLAIQTEILPQAMQNSGYNAKIEAIGGAETYSWRISQGQLPPGLILAQAPCTGSPCKTNGVISGRPWTPGTYTFTVTLSSGTENISRQFSIVVVQALNAAY